MKHLIRTLFVIQFALWLGVVSATPLTGQVKFFDPTGIDIFGGTGSITGDLDTLNGTMSVDPFLFFGQNWVTKSVELLEAGTHSRSDGQGGTISVTVDPGQTGAYMMFEWSFNEFPAFMVWDVTSTTAGGVYTTLDSDGDGIPGQAFVVGPFVGLTVVYDFTVGEPPPGVTVAIGIEGGTTQECTEIGGSVVSLTVTTELVGGAELGSIEWTVDGESAGSGATLVPFMALGSHTVEVLASTTSGESDTDSVAVEVRDTVPPDLDVAFLNRGGEPITAIDAGNRVTTRIAATDVCDPDPVTEGAAVPVFAVSDGDTIRIQPGKTNTVKLPTTAIELSATAADASGNSTTGMAVLSITD
jgi:hypothetical protein